MARKPRVHFPGAYYHVMLRGNGGMTIFADDNDRKFFYKLVEESVLRFEYRVHAFCLMTNHVHFALQAGEIALSKIIHNISFRYTRYFNKKQKRIGHLFQGRYKALLVDADSYLLQLVRYIHRNPIQANMVKKLDDYLWSSHGAYAGLTQINWLTKGMMLNMLTMHEDNQIKKYRQLVEDMHPVESIDFERSTQKSFPAICDDHFMLRIASLQNNCQRKLQIKLCDLVKHVCEHYAVEEERLSAKTKNRQYAKLRAIVAWLAVQFEVATIQAVAEYFCRDASGVSRGLSRLSKEVTTQEFAEVERRLKMSVCQA